MSDASDFSIQVQTDAISNIRLNRRIEGLKPNNINAALQHSASRPKGKPRRGNVFVPPTTTTTSTSTTTAAPTTTTSSTSTTTAAPTTTTSTSTTTTLPTTTTTAPPLPRNKNEITVPSYVFENNNYYKFTNDGTAPLYNNFGYRSFFVEVPTTRVYIQFEETDINKIPCIASSIFDFRSDGSILSFSDSGNQMMLGPQIYSTELFPGCVTITFASQGGNVLNKVFVLETNSPISGAIYLFVRR